jgi:hypothetical protein
MIQCQAMTVLYSRKVTQNLVLLIPRLGDRLLQRHLLAFHPGGRKCLFVHLRSDRDHVAVESACSIGGRGLSSVSRVASAHAKTRTACPSRPCRTARLANPSRV